MASDSDTTCPLTSLQLKTYSASYSLYLCANDYSLVSWFLLVASSSIFLSKNVNFFYAFRLDLAKYISFPERTTPKVDNTNSEDSWVSFCGNSGLCYASSSENPSTPLSSTTCDSSSEVSDLDKASYWDCLLNLEGEDCEWISEFEPSSSGSTECDSSDLDTPTSYLDSLLSLEDEDSELWLSDLRCEAVSDMGDEPLFWPFEEEFNWNSRSSFCMSPRKHINKALVEGKSEASRPRRLSAKKVKATSEKRIEKDEVKSRVVARIKPVCVGNGKKQQVGRGRGYCAIETQVGLEEFDGHEGIDAEFKGNIFMLLDECLS